MMSSWSTDYIVFLAKTMTATLAVLVVLGQAGRQKKQANDPDVAFINLTKKRSSTLKRWCKALQIKKKKTKKDKDKPNLFILTFEGDIKASATTHFRKQVSAILALARPKKDQVLIKLTSSGGQVSPYGLAAAQIMRLRDANVHVHVMVDEVAASGGYLMAAMADRITAAPFAILGSIGVILQLPNFHRLIRKSHIEVEQITAGEDKRNLTMFTENSKEDRAKAQAQVDKIHGAFKTHLQKTRPGLKDESMQGDVYLAPEALELGLIDAVGTSDAYLEEAHNDFVVWDLPTPKSKNKLKKWLASMQDAMGAWRLSF